MSKESNDPILIEIWARDLRIKELQAAIAELERQLAQAIESASQQGKIAKNYQDKISRDGSRIAELEQALIDQGWKLDDAERSYDAAAEEAAELEVDLAAAIAQIGYREQIMHAQSVEITRLTALANDLVEES